VNPCCYPLLGMSEFLSATPLQTEGHDVAVQYTFASDCHYECCCINRGMVARGWDIRVPRHRLCAYASRVGRGHWRGEAVAGCAFASEWHDECCGMNRVMVAHGWDSGVPLQRLCAAPSRGGGGQWMGDAVAWWGSYQSWMCRI